MHRLNVLSYIFSVHNGRKAVQSTDFRHLESPQGVRKSHPPPISISLSHPSSKAVPTLTTETLPLQLPELRPSIDPRTSTQRRHRGGCGWVDEAIKWQERGRKAGESAAKKGELVGSPGVAPDTCAPNPSRFHASPRNSWLGKTGQFPARRKYQGTLISRVSKREV